MGDENIWRTRGYPRFLAVRLAMSLAYQINGVAVGWRVYALTHSAVMLGFVGLVQFVPMLLITLPAGMAVDRFERKRIMALAQAGSAIALLALGFAIGLRVDRVWSVFAAAAMVGGMRSLDSAAGTSILPNLVPTALVPRAVAISSMLFQIAVVAGPALGGFLYVFGPAVPFVVAGVLYATAATLSLSLPLGKLAGPVAKGLAELFAGIRFIWHEKVVLGAISLDMFAVLLGGATALLPVYARDILHIGPLGLGVLRAAPAAGAVLGAILFARFPLRRHVGIKMFMGVLMFGLATIVFGMSRWLPLSLAALMILGMSDVVSVMVRTSMVQLRTPDVTRGRVAAVNSLFIGTSNQLGEFESGMVAGLLGPVGSVVTGGIGTILVVLAWMKLFPGLRTADRIEG